MTLLSYFSFFAINCRQIVPVFIPLSVVSTPRLKVFKSQTKRGH